MRQVLYLHGFASSAQSSKARFFRTELAACGIAVQTPDFNLPDFSTLTVSRMLGQVRDAVAASPPGPIALVGSSLGAFVAVHAALENAARVDRLVLLAPALDFGGNRMRDLGDRGIDDWRRTGTLDVFHYGLGRLMPVHFDLYTDAARYDALSARPQAPILIFQGRNDTLVDPVTVEQWAAARPNVQLRLLDDDHQLLGSLATIWAETAPFLGVTPPPAKP